MPAEEKRRADRQLSGAQGEAIVLYELMWHGWIPANINQFVKDARNIDIIAIKGVRKVALTVKASGKTGGGTIQIGGNAAQKAFNRHPGAEASFVVFVLIDNESSRKYRCFVVPVEMAEKAVVESHRHWMSHKRRDGKPRKEGIRGIGFFGRDTQGNVASDFSTKWREYENNWEQLESKTEL